MQQIDKFTLNRREFIKLMSIGGIIPSMPQNLNTVNKPNIVLILVDDLGYGDLTCYGSDDMRTPNLDNMAASGVRFENFYANCPVCSPTRASIMTGRYPDMVGVPGVIRTHTMSNFGRLYQNAVMLPEVLDKAGYETAIIGKWHLGLEQPNTPNVRGFDHFHGFLGDMMDDYYTHRRHDINYMRLNEKEIDPEGHATDLFSEWAGDYIRKQAGSNDPFFLYLAYNAPHTPIQPPEEWLVKVRDREPSIDEKRARLVALIEHMDHGIGKVLKALEESGQKEDTLVIFTSDNGGQLNVGANNGPLSGGKGQMLEGGIKEPMFATWPGHIEAGSHRSRVGLTMDLFPTICDAAGLDIRHEIDGASIFPDMLKESESEFDERMLFWVRREGGLQYGGQSFYAIRCGEWKLLQNTPFELPKLYNLKEDPKEENPMGKDREEYRMLFNEMQKHVIRTGAVPWQEYPVEL